MAENQETKNNRELFIERLRAKYPDREFVDDEALFGQAGADYADFDNQLNGYKEREGKLEKLFAENPRAAQFISDMAHGKDPWISVIEFVGSDGVLQLMNDPERQEALAAANKAYAERLAEQKRLEEEYEKNQAEAIQLREQLDAQYGEETVDAALAVIDQIFKDALVGKVTPETFDMALKVVRHDADVDNARSEGEIAGRNAKIEEKLRTQQSGDGMPAMGGSAAAPAPKKKGFFDDLPKRKF